MCKPEPMQWTTALKRRVGYGEYMDTVDSADGSWQGSWEMPKDRLIFMPCRVPRYKPHNPWCNFATPKVLLHGGKNTLCWHFEYGRPKLFKWWHGDLNFLRSPLWLIVTRAQGKQDPENHIRALPTVASAQMPAMELLTRPQHFAGYKNESYK